MYLLRYAVDADRPYSLVSVTRLSKPLSQVRLSEPTVGGVSLAFNIRVSGLSLGIGLATLLFYLHATACT